MPAAANILPCTRKFPEEVPAEEFFDVVLIKRSPHM